MQTNAQSISEISPSATPEQGVLPVGPIGVVHRGGAVPWHKRLALTRAPSPTAHHVLLVLGSFVSDGQSDAWPSVATLTSMTGLTRRTVQRALRALEEERLVQTETVSGRSSRYRLASTCVTVTPLPASHRRPPCVTVTPEGKKEVIKRRKAAALPTVQKIGQKGPRHTCSCGNNWPLTFGPLCFRCNRKVGVSHPAGFAAPVPGKYDGLYDNPAPPPMAPAIVADLEANAVSNGWHKRDGRWSKTW